MFIRISLVILVFVVGLAVGFLGKDYIPIKSVKDGSSPTVVPKSKGNKERKPLFYRNPMNPSITSPVPAKDEMGMDYIPVYPEDLEGGSSKTPGTVVIDPVTMQKMGVRTATVKCMRLFRTVTTYGIVAPDEETLFMVHARFRGWVERMLVKETDQWVKKGEVLLYVYSPEIVTAQDEFLISLKNLDVTQQGPNDLKIDAKRLYDASKRRLELFGLPGWFIRDLEKDRKTRRIVPVVAPADGFVTRINVRPRSFITPKTTLYALSDLRKIWVNAYFFEDELPWLREGSGVEVRFKGLPGRVFTSSIEYIYPEVDKKTRTIKARIVLDNPKIDLRPGMYATVTLKAGAGREVLVVPKEAVLRTGKQEHVFVALGGGKFEPRPVSLGLESDGLVEVKKGLRFGENVVVSGQFLIDSESSLKEAALKMMEPKQDEAKK